MTGDCLVLRELRLLRTNKKQAFAEYQQQVTQRRLEKDQADGAPSDTLERLRRCGFPVQAVATMREPKATPALAEAKRFCVDRAALFLVLLGSKGIGKTVAATHAAYDFARHFSWDSIPSGTSIDPLLFMQASELTRMSAFDRDDGGRLTRLEAAKLLVVDDMGDEGTDLGRSMLTDLLLRRSAKGRRTVITSNLRREFFQKRYGAALFDRIQSQGYLFERAGESLRRQYGESQHAH